MFVELDRLKKEKLCLFRQINREQTSFFYRKPIFFRRLWKKYVQNNKPGSRIS